MGAVCYRRVRSIRSIRSIKDATKALQVHFSAAKIPQSLPLESRRMLQSFVEENQGRVTEDDAARANVELKNFWERFVGDSPQKLGAFVGVLRELRPAIVGDANILDWWQTVVKPVVSGTGFKKIALDADRVTERTCMYLNLSFDHQVVDGAPAARFLQSLKRYLELPAALVVQTPR